MALFQKWSTEKGFDNLQKSVRTLNFFQLFNLLNICLFLTFYSNYSSTD